MSISIANKRQLIPSFEVNRSAPKNLRQTDEMFFSHEFQKTFPPVNLYELSNVNVSPEGIAFRNFEVFLPSLLNASRKKYFNWRYFLSNKLKRKKITLPENETYILAFDEWSNGYFHWMFDLLPRLMALNTTMSNLKNYYLLLPEKYDQQYMYDTLKIFDFKGVCKTPSNAILFTRNLMLTDHVAQTGNYNVELTRRLQEKLLAYYKGDGLSFGDKIYVSRKKAAHRFIANENDLVDAVEKLGFKPVCFEDYSIREKISICRNVKHIISAHGSGLVNMLFMPAGSSALEIRPEGDARNNAYYSLASCLDINYYYLFSKFENSNVHPNKYDLRIDIGQLTETVKTMIDNRT